MHVTLSVNSSVTLSPTLSPAPLRDPPRQDGAPQLDRRQDAVARPPRPTQHDIRCGWCGCCGSCGAIDTTTHHVVFDLEVTPIFEIRLYIPFPHLSFPPHQPPSPHLPPFPTPTSGSRKNIEEHYDAGNAMYRLFLDESMMYSAGIHRPGESLYQAQMNKLDEVIRQVR